MSSKIIIFGTLCLAMGLAVGCADSSLSMLPTVPRDELAQLPQECGSLLSVADDDLMWARAEGDASAIVLDTPDGSCVARRDTVLTTLGNQQRVQLVSQIAHDFSAPTTAEGTSDGPPSPHPDKPQGASNGPPSPHPDKPQGASDGPPSPHPDKDDSDDNDDVLAMVIVVEVVVGPGGGAGGAGGTPPPAPPPSPNKPD